MKEGFERPEPGDVVLVGIGVAALIACAIGCAVVLLS
jgi:hypothetical protein